MVIDRVIRALFSRKELVNSNENGAVSENETFFFVYHCFPLYFWQNMCLMEFKTYPQQMASSLPIEGNRPK